MKKIYLTGMSASGKTSLTNVLQKQIPNLEVISYSSLLKEYLNSKQNEQYSINDLRSKSSKIITPQDIINVDNILVKKVQNIKDKHIIIDSHAVTHEEYGFRTTPFTIQTLCMLDINLLVSLYANSFDLIKRQTESKKNIPSSSNNENTFLSINLQNNLLLNYGIILNLPVYFIDTTSLSQYEQIEWFKQQLL